MPPNRTFAFFLFLPYYKTPPSSFRRILEQLSLSPKKKDVSLFVNWVKALFPGDDEDGEDEEADGVLAAIAEDLRGKLALDSNAPGEAFFYPSPDSKGINSDCQVL